MPHERKTIIRLLPKIEDALRFGPESRPLDAVRRAEQRALGSPIDGPIVKDNNSIAVGGDSQVLFGARSNRGAWFVQNPIANTENIYVRDDGGDASATDVKSMEIPPGGSLGDDSKTVSQTEMTITAPTAGTKFLAEEYLK